MAGGAVVASKGPVLKGLHAASVKKHLAIAIGWSIFAMLAAKFTINEPKKAKYAEYYK